MHNEQPAWHNRFREVHRIGRGARKTALGWESVLTGRLQGLHTRGDIDHPRSQTLLKEMDRRGAEMALALLTN